MLESYFVSIYDHFNHEPFETLSFPFRQNKGRPHDQMGRSGWPRELFENLNANDRILFGVLIDCFLSSCLFFFFFFWWWWGRGVVVWEEPTLGLDLKSRIFLMLSRS